MQRIINHIIFLIAVALLVAGCDKQKSDPDNITTGVLSIHKFNDSIPANTSAELRAFLKTIGAPDFASWSQTSAARVFTPDADSVFKSRNPGQVIASVITNARHERLRVPAKKFATVVWSKRQSIIFTDSVMLIALNHYLGPDYPGYAGMPEYIRRQKSPEMLPYDIAEAMVATAYPYDGNNATVLNRLLYEGALAEAKMRLVKDASPAVALGYDDDTFKQIEQNEHDLWQKILEKKLLFDHDPTTAARLVAPSPVTGILGTRVPGRVGRYVGWRIIRTYLERNPDTTLSDILSSNFYMSDDILRKAGYRP